MTLSNVSKKKRTKRAKKILEQVGLKAHISKKPNQLSGGQKQRVAIARALINDPEVILADEPTGSLDSKTAAQILKLINDISKTGKLIIMVTHSEKVAAVATRVVRISDGKIISDEKTKEKIVYTEDNVNLQNKNKNLGYFSAIRLAFQNMYQKLGRNILVAIGSSIGIASVIIMLSIGQGVENYIVGQMTANVNPLVVEVNMATEISPENGPGDIQKSFQEIEYFEQEDIDKLLNIDNVVEYEKGFSINGVPSNLKFGEESSGIQMLNTTSSALTSNDLGYGEIPTESGILISSYVANEITEDPESLIGEMVEIVIPFGEIVINETIEIIGILAETDLQMLDGLGYAFISYPELGTIFEKYDLELKPTTIYLISEDEAYTDLIKEEITELGYSGSMEEMMINIFTDMLDVMTYILAAIAGISLFVSAIMILVVLYISVVERTKEIGVLKAIGARRKDIKRIFSTEALLLGLTGGVFGILGANGISALINLVTNSYFGVPLVAYSIKYMAFGMVISIVVSLVAGLYPASRAAKLDPIESLRYE